LYFYQARWYDAQIGRFIQPDTIIPEPGNPQALNRYAYTLNNPLKYTDPSGHWIESALDIAFIGYDIYDIKTNGLTWTSGLSLAADVAGLVLPVVTGGGLLVRGLAHADDAIKLLSRTDDVVKAASHVDDAAKAAVHIDDAIAAAATGAKKPVIIGENMAGRVNSYAKSKGAETIDDWLGGRKWTKELNEEYIETIKSEHREVVDIGPDFDRRLLNRIDPTNPSGRPPSSVYGDERRRLLDYDNYRREYERFGRYDGGVPGFDY